VSTETTGWHPGCECPANVAVPATVIDPFTGAGTTGYVAVKYGRRFHGPELNPEYAAMARKRIGSIGRLLFA
jgi:DNA modification methylase